MDIILSSFCFNNYKLTSHKTSKWYGLPSSDTSPFLCLPPVSLRSIGEVLEPDYSIFFLGDTFYVDYETIEIVERQEMFRKHRELFACLKDMGRLEIIDYKKVISPYSNLIESSYTNDINRISQWRVEFLELCSIWLSFIQSAGSEVRIDGYERFKYNFHDSFDHRREFPIDMGRIEFLLLCPMVPGLDWGIEENLRNWHKNLSPEKKQYTKDVLSPYLLHVSSNLCLADCLNASIHDWADISPLYRKKFDASLHISQATELRQQENCSQLIKLMFPNFKPEGRKSLLKLLTDKRIVGLRETVNKSLQNSESFDNEYANNLLMEIISKEEKINYYKNIVGWLTMPLSFIPWAGTPIEKGSQILIDKLIEKRIRKDKSWFYLLSEVNDQHISPYRKNKAKNSTK